MEIYYSLDKHNTGQDTMEGYGLHCGSVLTCLGELPHPGEVVHVAVAQQRVGAKVELSRDLEGGVGGQGGEVDSHQLVTVKPANNKHTLQPDLCLSVRPIKLSLQV